MPSTPAIDPRPFNETEGFKRAVTVFSQATNIVDLSFTNRSEWTSDPLYEPIKYAVAKMSLKRLTIWNDQGLAEVLRDQPELAELKVGWGCSGLENLENTDIPKLRSLAACLNDAAYLVPGRPIERLELDTPFGSPGFDRALFDRLSLSTKPVVHLSVALHNASEEEGVRVAIRAFARNWPDAETLLINVTGPITGKTILDEIPAFRSIRELAFLDAGLTTAEEIASADPAHDYGFLQQGSSEDWERLFPQLKDLCPTLVKAWYTAYVSYGCCSIREAPLKCQESSRFAQIPEDIIFLIAGYLDETTQASLVRTCRYFHHLLEVSLYRHITPVFPWKYHRSDRLFRTLLDRPDLLPYITIYFGPLLPSIITPPQKRRFLDRFKKWQRLSPTAPKTPPIDERESFKRAVTVFTQATNIVDLNFTDCSTWTSDPLYKPIKLAISKMSLKRLSIWECQGLVEVLRDQPELEELQLGWGCSDLDQLQNTDLPKLRSLSVDLKEAAYLVPGRPVDRLELSVPFRAPDFDIRLFDRLSLSTRSITYISATLSKSWGYEVVQNAIRAFARNCPDTERFLITVIGPITRKTILDEIPAFHSIGEVAFIDARLTTAEELASPNPAHDYGIVQQGTSEDWEQVFSHLKELCPTLVKTWHTPFVSYLCCCGISL
ncbi:hypothetical protein FRC01_010796 [Tulasnella sp. 417]|nr:hypothetical protein FRC01_010796 [Tulasnella sp. 417]